MKEDQEHPQRTRIKRKGFTSARFGRARLKRRFLPRRRSIDQRCSAREKPLRKENPDTLFSVRNLGLVLDDQAK